jgi:hypothetical protein
MRVVMHDDYFATLSREVTVVRTRACLSLPELTKAQAESESRDGKWCSVFGLVWFLGLYRSRVILQFTTLTI